MSTDVTETGIIKVVPEEATSDINTPSISSHLNIPILILITLPHPQPTPNQLPTTNNNHHQLSQTATMVSFTAIVLGFAATAITGANAALCRYPYDNCGWVLASYGIFPSHPISNSNMESH